MQIRVGRKRNDKYNKVVVVNFADVNYYPAQQFYSKTAVLIGGADFVYAFSPDDIYEKFYNKYYEILTENRGVGLWLWKPYIVKQVLELLQENDVLFYCDSGTFFIKSIRKLIKKCGDYEIVCCDIPLIEEQFTKKVVFDIVGGVDERYSKSNQIIGTFFII